MRRINRLLGGRSALRRHLLPRLLDAGRRRVRVVDLGCGGGDLAEYICRWAERRGARLQVTGVDSDERHLELARQANRRPEVSFVRAEAERLPFGEGEVDFLYSTLLMHHLDPPAARRVLAEAARVTRGAVVMNDLVRDRIPLAFYRLVRRVLAREEITRRDGAASIRRAYTPEEARRLLVDAGFEQAQVFAHYPAYRWTAVINRKAQ